MITFRVTRASDDQEELEPFTDPATLGPPLPGARLEGWECRESTTYTGKRVRSRKPRWLLDIESLDALMALAEGDPLILTADSPPELTVYDGFIE